MVTATYRARTTESGVACVFFPHPARAPRYRSRTQRTYYPRCFTLGDPGRVVAIARLVGAEVSVPLEERPAPPGEYYQTDLIGCQVVDAEGRLLGTVDDWQEYGPPLLDVRAPGGKELLIPFAKSICKNIDLAAKRIVVELPEGLLDLE